MTVDLSPIVNAALGLGGVGVSALGMWALRMLAQRMGVQIDAGQQAILNAALTKAISFGSVTAENIAAEKGWSHPDVKNAVTAAALQFLTDHAGGALKQVGLDPVADEATITAHINALLPTAMMSVAASPLTTNGPGAVVRPIMPAPPAPVPPMPAVPHVHAEGAAPAVIRPAVQLTPPPTSDA